MISIRMLTICRNVICKPLEIIYEEYLNRFVSLGVEKGHIAPVNKNGDKESLKTTDQCRYFQFWRNLFLTKCSSFLLEI